jgi:hypothetical protein
VSAFALRQEQNGRTWAIAWALTLALHALVFVALQAGRHWVPAPPKPAAPEPIHLNFVRPPPASTAPKTPTYFTELPADRADQPPAHADFLSNVTSRARDRVPGGDQSLPRMSGETDAPSVAMTAGRVEPKRASTPAQPPAQPSASADAKAMVDAPKAAAGGTGAAGATATPSAPHDVTPSSSDFPSESAAPGNSDIPQGEMDNPSGNAGLTGDVSLNTTAWDWAPWIQRFGRRLMRSWYAPPAYYMGVLKDGGWTVVEMEIARTGEVLRMEVLEEQGHPSLMNAATSALRSISPMEKLPTDFPEKTLILRVRMVYPKIRPH